MKSGVYSFLLLVMFCLVSSSCGETPSIAEVRTIFLSLFLFRKVSWPNRTRVSDRECLEMVCQTENVWKWCVKQRMFGNGVTNRECPEIGTAVSDRQCLEIGTTTTCQTDNVWKLAQQQRDKQRKFGNWYNNNVCQTESGKSKTRRSNSQVFTSCPGQTRHDREFMFHTLRCPGQEDDMGRSNSQVFQAAQDKEEET